MKRTVTVSLAATLSVFAYVLASPHVTQGQSSSELISKALDAVSIPGPHHLEAQVIVSLADGTQGKGTYSLDWAAPDRFREEIHIPGYDEIKVASGTTLFRKRSVEYIPAQVFELEDLMNPAATIDRFQRDLLLLIQQAKSNPQSGDDAGAAHLELTQVKIDDNEASCVWAASTVPELCTDAKRGWPLELTDDVPETDVRLQFNNYASLGSGHFSRHRLYSENGVITVEAKVKKLSPVKQFDAAAFSPPEGADQSSWCSDMVPPLRQPLRVTIPISPNDFPKPEVLYGLVSADGELKNSRVIQSAGPDADADVQKIANSIHFTPATCGGKPIESETRFMVVDSDFAPAIPAGPLPEAGKNGFTTPICAFCPIPPFPGGAFDVKFQGKVILSVIIARDGRAHDIRIAKSLTRDFDKQAAKTIRNVWRFIPAKGPDGKPAAVHVLVEVSFTAQSNLTSQLLLERDPLPRVSH
ncbi:MAG TPA: energy transducer TonB [Candidatus Acidoferrales bacterium]|nr:energy transducer TonB [Candidatus Acidoferrales bacterium]